MLQILSANHKELEQLQPLEYRQGALWYDLFFPTDKEVKALSSLLKIHIPSLEEMMEIEESSRLFEEDGILYMISLIVTHAESDNAVVAPVSFILLKESLVTVRYCDPKSFRLFIKKVAKNGFNSVPFIFLSLLDTIVERIADLLEINFSNINAISQEIFDQHLSTSQSQMRDILVHIGKIEDLNSKIRESLANIDRQLIFCRNHIDGELDKKLFKRLLIIQQDVKSLVDFLTSLSLKIDFLLNATLGFIDIEQNSIIKIFSVAAVIFLPPTLISSIYGMNFTAIPELKWAFGYPFALVLMVFSAIISFFYVKRKKWL